MYGSQTQRNGHDVQVDTGKRLRLARHLLGPRSPPRRPCPPAHVLVLSLLALFILTHTPSTPTGTPTPKLSWDARSDFTEHLLLLLLARALWVLSDTRRDAF